MDSSPILVANAYVPDAPSPTTTLANTKGAEGEGLSFGDMLEALNPLQHIPVVGTLYREITGEDIKTLPRLVGGALFGGVFGLIGAAIDSIVKEASGASPGEHLLHLVGLGHGADEQAPEVTVTELPSASDAAATGTDAQEAADANALVAVARMPGGVVPVPQLLIDEARNNPKSFAAATAQPPMEQPPTQRATQPAMQPVAAPSAAVQTAAAALPSAASAGPTEFFRSLQRANVTGRTVARPLPLLSTIETAPHAKSRTTAPGASAEDAATAPVPYGPANVGAPISILPAMQTPAQAQQAVQANPEALPAAMMAALDKYQAMKRAETAPQLSIAQ
jgi:hypothetical protein